MYSYVLFLYNVKTPYISLVSHSHEIVCLSLPNAAATIPSYPTSTTSRWQAASSVSQESRIYLKIEMPLAVKKRDPLQLYFDKVFSTVFVLATESLLYFSSLALISAKAENDDRTNPP